MASIYDTPTIGTHVTINLREGARVSGSVVTPGLGMLAVSDPGNPGSSIGMSGSPALLRLAAQALLEAADAAEAAHLRAAESQRRA